MTRSEIEEMRLANDTSSPLTEFAEMTPTSNSPGFDAVMEKFSLLDQRVERLTGVGRPLNTDPFGPPSDDPSQIPWVIGAVLLTLGIASTCMILFEPGGREAAAYAWPTIRKLGGIMLTIMLILEMLLFLLGRKGLVRPTVEGLMGMLHIGEQEPVSEMKPTGTKTTPKVAMRTSEKKRLLELVRRDAPEHIGQVESALTTMKSAWSAIPHSLDPMSKTRVETIFRQAMDLTIRLDRAVELADPVERHAIVSDAVPSIMVLASAADEERRAILNVARDALDQQRRYIDVSHPKEGPLSPIV